MTDGPSSGMSVRWRTILLALAVIAVGIPTSMAVWDRIQLRTGWLLPARAGSPMLVIAHRGNVADFPENTAEAIWSAVELGPDGVEFDVHQSADGSWWVMHDPTVGRTTDAEGAVRNLRDATMAQLRIDGGLGFDSERHAALTVPRLEDVLDGLAGYRGLVVLDLQHAKDVDPGDLAAQLHGINAAVICRDAADAAAVKRVDPDLLTLLRAKRYEVGDPVDHLLMDATREATLDAVAVAPLGVFAFVDEGAHGASETGWFRSAWATGVQAFLTKDVAAALRLRQALVGNATP